MKRQSKNWGEIFVIYMRKKKKKTIKRYNEHIQAIYF